MPTIGFPWTEGREHSHYGPPHLPKYNSIPNILKERTGVFFVPSFSFKVPFCFLVCTLAKFQQTGSMLCYRPSGVWVSPRIQRLDAPLGEFVLQLRRPLVDCR